MANSQEQNKYIGRKKITTTAKLTEAEFDEALKNKIKGEPLEVSQIMPGAKNSQTAEAEPKEVPPAEDAKKPPVENFNPQMNEPPPKQPQNEIDTQIEPPDQPPEPGQSSEQENQPNQNKEAKDKENEAENQNQDAPENVRKNLLNRAKEFYIQKKKALVDGLKKNFSKAGAKAAARAVWAFIAAYWPYILAVLVIFFIILMIASSCSRQTGKTPTQPLEKTRDEKLVLQFLASAGEKSAQRELIAKQAIEAKSELDNLLKNNSSINNAEGQKIIEQIKKYIDEIITLSDNNAAIKERVNQIDQLLDKLNELSKKTSNFQGIIGQANAADNTNPQIEAFRAKINTLNTMIDFYQRGHLVVNPKDIDYVREYQADRRIVQMLVYLVTPIDQGGAGHERIKVKRIKFSYDSERKSVSKETDYSEKDEPNVSAHYTGQAADIVEADCIKCTEIKRRRLLSDKKKAQPPIPIKLAWQSEAGFEQTGGPDAYGQNMHQVFNNLANGAVDEILIAEISDILGVDLDPDKIKGKTLPEISRYIGNAMIKETLGIPGDYELGNNLEDIALNTGRAYLANAMGVPIEGLKGSTVEEIEENVGRAVVEKKMSLPEGSLEGNNSGEIFASVGRRTMESSLDLSRNSLAMPFNDTGSFRRALGQGKIENSLGLKPQTFYGASIEEIKERLGKDAFGTTFANPETIDNWLGIATGTTEALLNGQLSPDGYRQTVGEKVYNSQLAIYQQEDKRAEVYGVRADEMSALLSGNQGIFVSMGKTIISRTATVSDDERALMRQWFESKNKPDKLDDDYIDGQYGLKPSDFAKIFVDDLAKEVFERLGQTEILNNLANDPKIGGYVQSVQDFQFYNDRLHLIKDDLNYLEKESPSPEVRAKASETKKLVEDVLGAGSISDVQKNIKQVQKNVKFMEEKSGESDPEATKKIKEIKKAINEMIEGKEIKDFENVPAETMKAKTDPQVKLTKKDIFDVLTKKKKVDDLIYAVGLRKWEIELDLPDNSLQNSYKELKKTDFKNSSETTLISIGKTRLDEYGGVGGRNSEEVDNDLGLPAGTTANYRAGKITENAYHKKIGMGSTNNVAAKLLNRQLGLTDNPYYALQGTDVSNILNGNWFLVALKIGGQGVDKTLGFPEGGMFDIIGQTNKPGDVMGMLAEKKLGIVAGLDRPVSINGDITYNLGRVKIEQELGLKPNELNDNNLIDRIKGYTGSDNDSLSRLDMAFGLEPWTSQALIEGGVDPHEYITKTGEYSRNNVFYDQIIKYSPSLKNKDIKSAAIALAEQTGTPQDILAAAGASQVGQVLGLDYPVSIRGNFKDNLGAAKVEDRLGLFKDSFQDNIDSVIILNGQNKFESAFYIESGEIDNARRADSGFWNDDRNNQAKLVDAILNIPSGNTKNFLTGAISLAAYVDKVGQSSLWEVSVDKIADIAGLEEKYQTAAQTLVSVLNTDPSLSSPQSQRRLFEALTQAGGWNLDNKTKFDPGTWENILFVNPADPEHTGPRNADYVLLEQGKKWLPRWLGMDEKYDPYMDLIYEKGLQAGGRETLYNEEVFTNAVQQVTGIPDENDAKRFTNGDIKGGLTAWGAAQITKAYNEEFGDQITPESTLDYYTAKKAYFNDLKGETAIGDAAVEKTRQDIGGGPISPDAEQAIRQSAIRESRDNAKKDLQYKVVDMQLHKRDKNIPAGFTQAMREGTSEQKWNMGLTYIGNMVHSKNPQIPAELMPDLEKYFNADSPTFHDPKALTDTSYSFLDGKLTEWMGDFVQPGTTKALFTYGQTGKLGSPSPQDQGSLTQIYTDYGVNVVTNWADKQTGLPQGTTKLTYDYFVKYQDAVKAYRSAVALGDTAKIASSAAALNSLKADAISTVITVAFQKQLLAADQQLGLVPGSSSMLVGMTVGYLITGAVNPWMIGYFVLTNLFGVYKIDVTCTACGYYPEMTAAESRQYCPLGEFDGKSNDAFRINSIAAAQWKVNQLINDVLQMPKALNDDNLTPTQIMTYRQEDVDSFSNTLNDMYGSAGLRGNSGLWSNELMWDHVHIGY